MDICPLEDPDFHVDMNAMHTTDNTVCLIKKIKTYKNFQLMKNISFSLIQVQVDARMMSTRTRALMRPQDSGKNDQFSVRIPPHQSKLAEEGK
jgi:hypothetical protein